VSKPPEFRDLVGDDLSPDERARLERVHDMLISAGPPPELPPELQEVPSEHKAVADPVLLPRRRVGAALALAAAIALIAFLGGYVAGNSGTGKSFQSVRNVTLGNTETKAVVRFAPKDANGNTTMDLKVKGLRPLPERDYYVLLMTKNGKPVVECGTFNIRRGGPTTFKFTVAYDPANFDGLQLARWRHSDHKDVPIFDQKI
jgi:hypothetical protein